VAVTLAPLGLHGTLLIAFIPLIAAALIAVVVRRFREQPGRQAAQGQEQPAACEWRPFATLVALFCLANGVATGLLTYVPLFLLHERAASPAASNVMTSVLLAAAAAGTLLGGFAAQRLGRRLVLVVPQLVLVPAIALLPSLQYGGMIPVMIVVGIALNANVSVALVLAQEYLPSRMGLATGLTIGLCSGAGGLIVALLGLLGDVTGPGPVLYALAALPLGVALLASRLTQPAAAPTDTIWSLRAAAGS
jgi:MFS transporter, FSR family, fosmidomycin resistance protein